MFQIYPFVNFLRNLFNYFIFLHVKNDLRLKKYKFNVNLDLNRHVFFEMNHAI